MSARTTLPECLARNLMDSLALTWIVAAAAAAVLVLVGMETFAALTGLTGGVLALSWWGLSHYRLA